MTKEHWALFWAVVVTIVLIIVGFLWKTRKTPEEEWDEEWGWYHDE